MATHPKLASEHGRSPGATSRPGPGRVASTSATSSSATTLLTKVTGPSCRRATERTRGLWQTLQPLLATEREKGHPRRVAGPFRHPRARARLHRQGSRDHRRSADRRAAQAGDHAVRRLARGRGEPRSLRLQARRGRGRDLHQVPQDAQRRRVRRLHAGHQEGPFLAS